MSGDAFWNIYKVFYSPPGTPDDLRCITCRRVTSGASFGLAAACLYGAKRTGAKNIYIGGAYVFAAITCLGAGTVAFRMAIDDNKWNESRLKERAMNLKRQRRANSEIS